MRSLVVSLALVLASTAQLLADVESGPKAGAKVEALKVLNVVGEHEGKEVDFVAERKDSTTVYLFVNAEKFDRPMNQFIKGLDAKLPDLGDGLSTIAVWYGGDHEKTKTFLPRVQMSVMYANTSLSAYEGEISNLVGWDVNTSAHLTVVVVSKAKVVKSFAYETVNGEDVKAVVEELKALKK
jgi:hypothetical protein